MVFCKLQVLKVGILLACLQQYLMIVEGVYLKGLSTDLSSVQQHNLTIITKEGVISDPTPVVLMHGLGDKYDSDFMKQTCQIISDFTGGECFSANVANGVKSAFRRVNDQVNDYAQVVRTNAALVDGFHAIGISQGSLITRGYIEKYNNPPVKKFFSIHGPQNGVTGCPEKLSFICTAWKLSAVYKDYYKPMGNKDEYLAKNAFIADINNERTKKNEQYRKNMMSLDKLILVQALQDDLVVPYQSSTFGYYDWEGNGIVETMKETKAYKEDWIGLKTLDEQGKIKTIDTEFGHVDLRNFFWQNHVLPELVKEQE